MDRYYFDVFYFYQISLNTMSFQQPREKRAQAQAKLRRIRPKVKTQICSLSDTVSGQTLKSKNTIHGRNSEATNPQSKISNWSKRQWKWKAVSLSQSLSNLLKGTVGIGQIYLQLFFLRDYHWLRWSKKKRRCWIASMPHRFPTFTTSEENKKGHFFFFLGKESKVLFFIFGIKK